jgi:hypothetical protein
MRPEDLKPSEKKKILPSSKTGDPEAHLAQKPSNSENIKEKKKNLGKIELAGWQ